MANPSNIKLLIAYDGAPYLGWQKNNVGPSVESTLQDILEQILQEKIQLQAASRTDAGVHARGQVVNFLPYKPLPDLSKLQHSLNSLLKGSIVVCSIERMPHDFHPTLDCIGKEYRYTICYGAIQMPQHRFYSWHYPERLNLQLMREAADLLKGTHDFSAFCNFKKNASYTDYVRTIHEIKIVELSENSLELHISGNHFLYKMVRNIVGTLAYVGNGKLLVDDVPQLLLTGDRTQAGVTAPAHGLTLHHILYPE
ncbi:MAG: tRNA pseudouridine(38-40) synthase TruA [Parachlamydiaceae bacterium]|nr:tRNA pseudouridine(38-40) synthase TruA [Parachlamydiaceae bacterium]